MCALHSKCIFAVGKVGKCMQHIILYYRYIIPTTKEYSVLCAHAITNNNHNSSLTQNISWYIKIFKCFFPHQTKLRRTTVHELMCASSIFIARDDYSSASALIKKNTFAIQWFDFQFHRTFDDNYIYYFVYSPFKTNSFNGFNSIVCVFVWMNNTINYRGYRKKNDFSI